VKPGMIFVGWAIKSHPSRRGIAQQCPFIWMGLDDNEIYWTTKSKRRIFAHLEIAREYKVYLEGERLFRGETNPECMIMRIWRKPVVCKGHWLHDVQWCS
jgi:hypothetical protein